MSPILIIVKMSSRVCDDKELEGHILMEELMCNNYWLTKFLRIFVLIEFFYPLSISRCGTVKICSKVLVLV